MDNIKNESGTHLTKTVLSKYNEDIAPFILVLFQPLAMYLIMPVLLLGWVILT